MTRPVPAPFGLDRPDAEAITHYGAQGVVRWRRVDLWVAVDAAAGLIEAWARPGGLVLVVARSCPEAMALFLGAIAAGRVASFFPPPNPIQDAEHYDRQQSAAITRIDPALIVTLDAETTARLVALTPTLADRVLRAREISARGDAARAAAGFIDRLDGRVAPEAPLFVQHSSGTTGLKKACAIGGTLLRAQHEAYWRGVVRTRLSPEPRIATWLPLYHDMGLVAAFLLLILDAVPIAAMDAFDWVAKPQILFDMIAAERSTLCWMPNFAFRHFVRLRAFLEPRELSSVAAWVNCSEPCRADDAEAFERTFADWGARPGAVAGCYAMAETVFAVSQAEPGRRSVLRAPTALRLRDPVPLDATAPAPANLAAGVKRLASSGRPVPGVEIAMRVGGEPAPEGVYGEVAIRAPFLFDGYRGLGRAESGLGPDGFFMTGDLGVVLDGELFVFGRTKETIIVNGKNLHAGDVEYVAGRTPGVKPGWVAAFGVENARTGSEDLVILAERDAAAPDADAAIRAAIAARVLGAFLVSPADVRILAERALVKSTSGKISRDANRDRYLSTLRAAPG